MIPWNRLEALCSRANLEIVLAAPFIKRHIIEQLLQVISDDIDLKVVTRWHPAEIASGVSDVDIWLPIQTRTNSRLLLRSNLHAKYYRGDNQCLVGSANLTGKGLGTVTHSNLELLLDSEVTEELRAFEELLLQGCVQVDQDIFEAMKTLADAISPQLEEQLDTTYAVTEDAPQSVEPLSVWLPRLRHPEQLFVAYTSPNRLTTASREQALDDLAVLQLPSGLSRDVFENSVAMQLLQMPLVRKIDSFLEQPRRFGEVKQLLLEKYRDELVKRDPEESWQTLMRWLLHYLASRYQYKVFNYSEILVRM